MATPAEQIQDAPVEISYTRKHVERGKKLVRQQDNSAWGLGDLTVEFYPTSYAGSHNGAVNKLKEFAEEIEIGFEALRKFREVATAWPTHRRVATASWSIHMVLKGEEDRFDLINTLQKRAAGEDKKFTVQYVRDFLNNRKSNAADRAATAPDTGNGSTPSEGKSEGEAASRPALTSEQMAEAVQDAMLTIVEDTNIIKECLDKAELYVHRASDLRKDGAVVTDEDRQTIGRIEKMLIALRKREPARTSV